MCSPRAQSSYRLAKLWWGETEALIAACLLSFFLAFYLPSAVIPFAADAVMLVPHLLAMYSAAAGRYFWAGVWAGIGFLANIKGAFVLAAVAVSGHFRRSGCLCWASCFPSLREQCSSLSSARGRLTSSRSGVGDCCMRPVHRCSIHGPMVCSERQTGPVFTRALILAAAIALPRLGKSLRWRLGGWIVLSLSRRRARRTLCAPLLPPASATGRRSWPRSESGTSFEGAIARLIAVMALTALVPLVRFGPRYLTLAFDNLRGR